MANLLARETSPYLLQHKDNPVAWRPWGKDALDEAKASGKPLLVSVGYAACHWCHVMAHESFEDAETAALMNDLFIPVKVDREERPDIDGWLQTALSVLGQGGGWPLTAFLTPKGEPFWAGTYFPKEESFGRPAFKTVLKDVAQRFRDEPDIAEPNIKAINQVMEQAWSQNRSGGMNMALLERVAVALAQRFDIFFGGITGQQKFPNVPSLELVWRAYLRTGAPQYAQITATTLDAMCRGGIYDHVGGGFARYATDERWLVPHFEKMLYDNAALVEILTLVWQNVRAPLYQQRIAETIEWILREMRVEDGFASALDADSEGEEGKYYIWSETEIDQALAGTMGSRFKQVYGVTKDGILNGRNVLNRLSGVPTNEADEALFKRQRGLLLAARQKRVPPQRDDKVLADWNGMMIAAMANAGAVFKEQAWIDAAKRAFAFIVEKLGDGDRLFHTYRDGKRQHIGFSDDYAQMSRAALTLYETTGDSAYLERAKAWVKILDAEFWDKERGGYAFTTDRGEPIHVKIRTAFDTQTPAANGVMVGVLGRLFFMTGEGAYGEKVTSLINAFSGDAAGSFMQLATFLNNFEFCAGAVQIIVLGPHADSRTHDLIAAVLGRSLPNRVLTVLEPGGMLHVGHPAHGKTMQNGQPTAYICQGSVCSSPITSAVMLSQVLQLPRPPAGAQQQAAAPAANG